MKKFIIPVLSLLVFGFASCNGAPDSINNPSSSGNSGTSLPVIDLRIKDASGQALNRSAEDVEFSYEFIDISKDPKFGLLTEEEVKNILSFEDAPDGIKITFTKPEKYSEDSYIWFELTYIDGNGKWSTRQGMKDAKLFRGKRSFSWIYPLVIPGRTVTLSFQIQLGTADSASDFRVNYKVTPVHGIGIVDDLPADYDETKYIEYDKGKVSLVNVIPPESSSLVEKSYGFWGVSNKANEDKWNDNPEMFDNHICEKNYFGLPTDFYLFTDKTNNKPYFFVQCGYDYTIEGYDGLSFRTPRISMAPVDNDFFNKPSEKRIFSSTELKTTEEGTEVTFSGDTSFDGFFLAEEIGNGGGVFFYEGKMYGLRKTDSGYSLIEGFIENINTFFDSIRFTETGFESVNFDGDVLYTYTKQNDVEKIIYN